MEASISGIRSKPSQNALIYNPVPPTITMASLVSNKAADFSSANFSNTAALTVSLIEWLAIKW